MPQLLLAMQGTTSQDLQAQQNAPADSAAISDLQVPAANPIAASQRQGGRRNVKKSNQICRFYNTKNGCRAGTACPYQHVQKTDVLVAPNDSDQKDDASTSKTDITARIQSAEYTAPPQRRLPLKPRDRAPVPKPVSSLQQKDPREFEIGQVVRRFAPTREEFSGNTILRLKLEPSDPDFPFDLNALDCVLTVPSTHPQNGKPSIRIDNKDIPRGFQINIERGFDSLCTGGSRTLLQLMNDLDRNLERFLTSEKAQTVKIIPNRKKEADTVPQLATSVVESPRPASISTVPTRPTWTTTQKAEAKSKRDREIQQLQARMNRVALFSSSKDGVTFNVPLQIPKPSRLPLKLQSLKETTLAVPSLYDLEPCRIKLKGVHGSEAEIVEMAFEKYAQDHRDLTLMAHINHLTQNLHTMALSSLPIASQPLEDAHLEQAVNTAVIAQVHHLADDLDDGVIDKDRPHLRFLSHPPPEWIKANADEVESDSETSDEYESETDSDVSEGSPSVAGGAAVPPPATSSTLEKGVLLSFPQLELHGIELLELRDISLSVKCDRCKQALDIQNIKPVEPTTTSVRTESCNKCASPISVSYRPEPMHINSIKAGYLDLEGCTIIDLLPSHFLPTCSECSTTHPLPGIVTVRGSSPTSTCRECHHRQSFKIPEIKFLRVSTNDPRLHLPLRSKRKRENLGITAGTPLPDRGRCKHYSKSYRWFRFSCCNRVYACDRCHDEKEDHPNEHANRMICGWCSREQNYRPEDCHACGRSVVRKTAGGFWEGGKGTRDKARMSRKDPRKFKRIGGAPKT